MTMKLRVGILLTALVAIFGCWLFNTKPAKRIISSQGYIGLNDYFSMNTNFGQPERIIEEIKSDAFQKVVSRLSKVPVSLLKENRFRLRNGYVVINKADFFAMEPLNANDYYSTYVGLRMGGFSVPYAMEFLDKKKNHRRIPPDIQMICEKYPWVNPNRLINEKAKVSILSTNESSDNYQVYLVYLLDDPPLKREYALRIWGGETNWDFRLDNRILNDKDEVIGYDNLVILSD